MSVCMEKATDGTVKTNQGVGMNSGSGPVLFIGGLPTAKITRKVSPDRITGAVIRVGGARIDARPVHFLLIGGDNGDAWIMNDGSQIPTGSARDVGEWLRFLLDTGIYAGIVRLR